DLAADPCPRAAVEHLVGALRDAAQRLAALRPAAMPSNRDTNAAHEVFDRAADTADALRALDVEDDELVATVWVDIGAMWSERVAKVGQWSRGETLTKIAKHFERVEDVVEAAAALREPLETVRSVDPRVLRASFAALGGVLGAVERELADRGVLGFDDLLRGARDLLVSRPAVAAQLRGEIEQLLVDEFQDTDALQCDLVRALALPRAADDDGPRPGLFLVGDPKQSIYGWRDADLGAYEAFVGDVVRAGGRALELAVNFRSVPAVLAEVERSLAHAMQAEPGVQAAFEPLFASERNASAPGFAQDGGAGGDVEGDAPRWAPVEHWVSWDVAGGEKRSGPETRTAAATRVEARAFARDVRRLRDEHGVALERVALLVRQRGDVDVYLRALREEGVPYSAHAGPELASRREAVDAAAVLRCVLDPNDQIALVALLRSACVGVPDAALLPLWVGRLPQRFAELDGEPGGEGAAALAAVEALAREVAASLDAEVVPELAAVAGWEESLVAAARAVARLRASFERDAPDVFVERLRAELALDLAEAARFPGALRVANLARFHRELAEDLAAGCDEQVLLRRLRTGGARGRGAGEPVAVVAGAVQVMTIHGAKGLGFDHVYLAQVHKAASGGRARATEVERGIDGPEMRLLGTQTLGFARAKAARARRESAESVRALYVALTRAKQRLVVMGARPGDEKRAKLVDATAVRSLSYAELLALRDDAPDLDAPFGEGCARFVAGDALWRFPAL
ncbi:MAG: UvrD-helicase domain-containing protein, partial [Myxococcales bacterium]|nr:UvrD-helicase domain-containing protein [Myxococcales bacterium]